MCKNDKVERLFNLSFVLKKHENKAFITRRKREKIDKFDLKK